MVNLNARSNLTPDSTPWGKAIEKRVADLERENALLRNEVTNGGKNLNTLSKNVFGSTLQTTYQDDTQYFTWETGTNNNIITLEPTVNGATRTGRILVTGNIPIYMYNLYPEGSASTPGLLSWSLRASDSSRVGDTQNGNLLLVPRSTSVYEEVGATLPFSFPVGNLPPTFELQLDLQLTAPQNLRQANILIGAGWSIVAQQV